MKVILKFLILLEKNIALDRDREDLIDGRNIHEFLQRKWNLVRN